MKGVFSNFSSHVERKTISQLFPDIPTFMKAAEFPKT